MSCESLVKLVLEAGVLLCEYLVCLLRGGEFDLDVFGSEDLVFEGALALE